MHQDDFLLTIEVDYPEKKKKSKERRIFNIKYNKNKLEDIPFVLIVIELY
jgi:hypothetical protein